jgi:hypothetical protein
LEGTEIGFIAMRVDSLADPALVLTLNSGVAETPVPYLGVSFQVPLLGGVESGLSSLS